MTEEQLFKIFYAGFRFGCLHQLKPDVKNKMELTRDEFPIYNYEVTDLNAIFRCWLQSPDLWEKIDQINKEAS